MRIKLVHEGTEDELLIEAHGDGEFTTIILDDRAWTEVIAYLEELRQLGAAREEERDY